jgi:hypothetical protein
LIGQCEMSWSYFADEHLVHWSLAEDLTRGNS